MARKTPIRFIVGVLSAAAILIAGTILYIEVAFRTQPPPVALPYPAPYFRAMRAERRNQERKAYLPKVIVRNVHLKKTLLGEIGVYGKIKNTGDRTLKKVVLTARCLDDKGKPVHEKQIVAVRFSPWTREGKPLEPGAVDDFGDSLDAPPGWHGRFQVVVTDVDLLPR